MCYTWDRYNLNVSHVLHMGNFAILSQNMYDLMELCELRQSPLQMHCTFCNNPPARITVREVTEQKTKYLFGVALSDII